MTYLMPDFDAWKESRDGLRIADEKVNFLIAPEVLRKPNGTTLFTYEEVKEVLKTLPAGWQLPDGVIATSITNALGRKRGLPCGKALIDALNIPLDGYGWPGTSCQVPVERGKKAVCWLSDFDEDTTRAMVDVYHHRVLEVTPRAITLFANDSNPLGFPSCEDTSGCMILLVHVTTKRY